MSYHDDLHEPGEPDARAELVAIRAQLVALLERVDRALLAGPPVAQINCVAAQGLPQPPPSPPRRMTGAARGA